MRFGLSETVTLVVGCSYL